MCFRRISTHNILFVLALRRPKVRCVSLCFPARVPHSAVPPFTLRQELLTPPWLPPLSHESSSLCRVSLHTPARAFHSDVSPFTLLREFFPLSSLPPLSNESFSLGRVSLHSPTLSILFSCYNERLKFYPVLGTPLFRVKKSRPLPSTPLFLGKKSRPLLSTPLF